MLSKSLEPCSLLAVLFASRCLSDARSNLSCGGDEEVSTRVGRLGFERDSILDSKGMAAGQLDSDDDNGNDAGGKETGELTISL